MRLRAFGLFFLAQVAWQSAGAQCPDGAPPPCRAVARPASAPAANSIAVLYFDNLSRDSANAYLADGLTEELISRLTQVEKLQVKSRTAVQRLRGRSDIDPASIGRTLGVAQLLSGSVMPTRGRLRVTVELTKVASGNTMWSRSYDRPAEDLISVEAEIAESIAVNVAGRLAPAERQRIEARPTRSAVAYDHLLRGRFNSARRTTAGLLAAVREYETAVRLDTMLTSALVGASSMYSQLAGTYYGPEVGISRDSLSALSRAAMARAIRRDSGSAEVLATRAQTADPARARSYLERAIAIDPRQASYHHFFGVILRQAGEDSAAVAELRRAIELEPDRIISLETLGQAHLIARRYPEAIRWLDSSLTFQPEAAFFYMEVSYAHLLVGDTTTALHSAGLAAIHGNTNGREKISAMIEARRGDSVAAQRRMLVVDSASAQLDCELSHDCLDLSFALAAVGLRGRALDVFERLRPRGAWLAYFSARPEFDMIRSEPRFQRVIAESRANGR